MKYIKQFSIILVFTLLGEALNYFLPLPVPASVYGIVLLFLALETGLVKTENVEDTGKFLHEIMPLTFISPAVGLIDAWADIKGNLLLYFAVSALTTVLVMGVSALTTQGVIRLLRKKRAAKRTPYPSCDNVGINADLAASVGESETSIKDGATVQKSPLSPLPPRKDKTEESEK